MQVLDRIRQHAPSLVEQAQLVSHELIRMAILWHEMWHEVREGAVRGSESSLVCAIHDSVQRACGS